MKTLLMAALIAAMWIAWAIATVWPSPYSL